jgi:hypothetical protein
MFRAFEPAAPAEGEGRVLLTVGELSPQVRHGSVRRLAAAFAFPVAVIPGTARAAHLENPAALAATIRTRGDRILDCRLVGMVMWCVRPLDRSLWATSPSLLGRHLGLVAHETAGR